MPKIALFLKKLKSRLKKIENWKAQKQQ